MNLYFNALQKIKKIFKWFLISFLIITTLIIGAGFIIAYFYEDEVKEQVIGELNKYINTEIAVSDISFSVFKKFPDAAIELKNVVAKSTNDFNKQEFHTNCDTLFTSESLFLQFNIIDIINKNYKLKLIDVYKGSLNIFIDKNGKDNFHFWKENESTDSDFEIKLKKLIFNDINLKFISKPKGLELETFTSNLNLSGDFASGDFELTTEGEFKIEKFLFDKINYFSKKNVNLDIDLNVSNNNYTINSGRLKVENLLFNISGNVNISNSNNVNLTIKSKDIDIRSFISLLPDKYKQEITDFSSDGLFYFNSTISGIIDNKNTPHIEIDFGVENGEIQRNSSNIKLTNVNIKGNYTNGKNNNMTSSLLVFNTFDVKMENSSLQGSYKMKNFKKPKIELIADAKLELSELVNFFEFDSVEDMSGLLETNLKYHGTLDNIGEITVKDFRKAKTEGKVHIKNGKIFIKNSNYDFSGINGGFTFNNNDLRIDSLNIIINENDFFVKGYFKNILSYILLENQNLNIDGTIKSKTLDIKKLITANNKKNEAYEFPDKIQINANVEIEHFKLDRFVAENVAGKIIYTNRSLTSSPLSFSTMDGKITATGTIYQNKDNTFTTKYVTKLSGIDITKLFYAFRNFGQTLLQDKHLKGKLMSDIEYSSNWSNTFDIIEKSIIATGNIKIAKGELIDFEALEKLSKYISLEELKHIKFSTLENDILIQNRKITIPQMEIKSSAANIELSGEHTFDNKISYRLKLLLSDILFKKAKKNKKENMEFCITEDDDCGKTSIYLSITGTTDDYKIAYDTKKVKDHIKESLKKEKQNLKKILNEEFGWFKNDSTIIHNKIDKSKSNTKFTIIWDEESEDNNYKENDDEW